MNTSTDVTSDFFENLKRRKHIQQLEHADGSVRFDIADKERVNRYLVSFHAGDVAVTSDGGAADCVISTDRSTFEDIVAGKRSAMSEMLVGTLLIDGDLRLAVISQRIFSAAAA